MTLVNKVRTQFNGKIQDASPYDRISASPIGSHIQRTTEENRQRLKQMVKLDWRLTITA
jgi:hypothetical protein